MLLLYFLAALMAAIAWTADISPEARDEDTEARGAVRAMHLATWHQAASAWYGESGATRSVSGNIPQSNFASRLPGGTAGSAISFTATGLRSASDGAGTIVSWADARDLAERRLTAVAVVKWAGGSMSAGSFEAATATIVNPRVDAAGRIPVPPALAAVIPDGAPLLMTRFE